jgi:hypothetical protein
MLHRKSLGSIVISNYIRKVQLSKAQRPKYYEWDGVTIKCGSKKLLQKYIRPECKNDIILNDGNVLPQYLKVNFCIMGFNKNKMVSQIVTIGKEWKDSDKLPIATKYILCEEVKHGQYEKVVANETQAGTPKEHIINGQAFYNQTLSPFARVKVMETIKKMYYDKLDSFDLEVLLSFKNKLKYAYPLYIIMEVRDTIKSQYDNSKDEIGRRWDVGNRTEPYMKGFLDFIVNGYYTEDEDKKRTYLLKPLIEDDDRLHVSSGNNSFFTPIYEGEVPSLVFHFYQDTREIWKELKNINKLPNWDLYCEYLTNSKNSKGLVDIATEEGYYEWITNNS